ncbi:armadillo-type protein [Mycena vulgaris]|nr:armadillo-type protein [Mycena vulgaris]
MNSLTRQQTLESVRSWWSDSNPTGPNINLHALAKPLMKLMYHRQALYYIAEHRFTPLSRRDMEIYASYLGFKCVSSTTKTAVLRDLIARVHSNDDVVAVADFISLFPCDILLEAQNANVRSWMCRLLDTLVRWRPDPTVTWLVSVCKQLVSLLQDESETVGEEALLVLRAIAINPEGAQAVGGAHVLERVAELVESPNSSVRCRACQLLGKLASHKATVPGVLRGNVCEQVVTLLRDKSLFVIESALEALYWITDSPEGMQAAIDANLLDHVTELLESPTPYTRYSMCSMLVAHDGMLAALVRGTHCEQLVSLLGSREADEYVVAWGANCVIEVLRWIAKSPEGAQAVVDANVLDSVNYLLGSNRHVRGEGCKMLEVLVSHVSTVTAVLCATPCWRLVSLLR